MNTSTERRRRNNEGRVGGRTERAEQSAGSAEVSTIGFELRPTVCVSFCPSGGLCECPRELSR